MSSAVTYVDLMDAPTVPGEVYVPWARRCHAKGQVFVGPTIGTGTAL